MSGSLRPPQVSTLEFKSASLTIPVLLPLSNDIPALARELGERVNKAGVFFHNSPLLIDLQELNRQGLDLEIDEVLALVREQGLMPVGIRGGNEAQNEDALAMGLPVHPLPGKKNGDRPRFPQENEENMDCPRFSGNGKEEGLPQPVENKLITHPVRSGQRVYARGDLTVTAAVSAGAELMAEGNIHVYGSLRGRALAGVLGDASSRIFCLDMQAELLSIAGIYQLREEKGGALRGPVAVSLEDQALVCRSL